MKQTAEKKRGRKLKALLDSRQLLLMLLPAILYVVLFSYIPMFGIVLAFKDYNYVDGIFGSPWNGLRNFEYLFLSDKLWPLTRNTLLYNAAFILLGVVFQVFFAILLSEISGKWFKKVTQTMMFMPYFISWVVAVAIVQCIFGYESGILNSLLEAVGLERINIYSSTSVWPFLLVGFKIWKETGYGTIVYMAAITGIDTALYEAEDVDGATYIQKVWNITLPAIKPTIIIMTLLAIGQIFRGDFGLFYQLVGSNAAVLEVADVIDLFVYRSLLTSGDIGMSSAAGLYQSVLCFVTIVFCNWVIKKVDPDYVLF